MFPTRPAPAAWPRLLAVVLPAFAAGTVMMTTACAASGSGANAPALRGTTWVLVGAAGEKMPRPPSLRLDPEQPRVNGFAGCNRLMGTFELDGTRLVFGSAATTRMACLDGEDVEQRFLQAYGAVRAWRIEGGELLLTGADGATLLRMKPGPDAKPR
ncbi:MAG: META domain-containing protein [Rubrivivax sp.]|nr:META domain-containing protein [Rubrivivax sp.]